MKMFKSCKHLDFNPDNYSAKLIEINNHHLGWLRTNPDGYAQVCQFCKLRGRINSIEGCIGEENANCTMYEEVSNVFVKE